MLQRARASRVVAFGRARSAGSGPLKAAKMTANVPWKEPDFAVLGVFDPVGEIDRGA
jgi:hypothetical protein